MPASSDFLNIEVNNVRYKRILINIALWLVSIFLSILGLFGIQTYGYFVCASLLFIAIFVNPVFSVIIKKRLYFNINGRMKAVAIFIAVVILVLLKLHIIGLNAGKDIKATTSSSITKSSTLIQAENTSRNITIN